VLSSGKEPRNEEERNDATTHYSVCTFLHTQNCEIQLLSIIGFSRVAQVQVTKMSIVEPNIYATSACNLLHVIHLPPKI
jgi:hypothetical protein